jgi:hypothetical protein
MPTPTQMIDLFDSDGARDEDFSDNLTGLEGI